MSDSLSGVHSVEEYVIKLYHVFPPARFASGLVSSDLARGFLILNAGIVTIGLFCWAISVRLGWPVAPRFMGFWTILELCNGLIHFGLALWRHGYFPGLATAPLMLASAGWLAVLVLRA